MSEFICTRRDICLIMIGSDNLISDIITYLRENYRELSEANIAKIIAGIQKNIITQFRDRYKKSARNKEQFLSRNSTWLSGTFRVSLEDPTCDSEPSTSTGKRGRPVKAYEDSSDRIKKQKNKDLYEECGLEFVLNSYTYGLRTNNEADEALIVQVLRTLPSDKKRDIRNNLLNEPEHIQHNSYSKDEALSIFIELDLTKAQYLEMRNCLIQKNCLLFPSYNSIRDAKKMCYPPASTIQITNIQAKINLQDLLDHTTARILKINDVYKIGSNHLKLYTKWGCDGSSGQSEYKQVLTEENELISDANLFICSLVPIKLCNEDTKETLWQNPAPSSVRYCRPILIEFSKETPDKTRSVVNDINAQIATLEPTLINESGEGIEIKHELFLTMVDGKVTQVLTETFSGAVCTICGAKPTEMNQLEKVRDKPVDENSYQYGLSTLHCWIRFMEVILHISYNLSFTKWSATTAENKNLRTQKKTYVQKKFREELGLNIDKPKQGSGNTNDGNTARRFFQNYNCTAEITGVDEELIKRFYVLLQVMSSGKRINAKKFGEYALDTAQVYVNKYMWYYMPSSVHKVLIHGESVIRHYSVLPLGQLSEDAQESRNKDYKRYRLHHARKCSRMATNEDVVHTLLYTSDPYITSLRKPYQKKSIELLDEAMELIE